MRFIGEYLGVTEDGIIHIKPSQAGLLLAENLNSGEYEISIKRKKQKRTIKQNAKLWQIISEINKAENGVDKTEEDFAIYRNILRMAGTGISIVEADRETLDALYEKYKIVDILDEGEDSFICKCYKGTSQLTKEEMSHVIDAAMIYAANVGLDTGVWD